jgi:hypothetical protein
LATSKALSVSSRLKLCVISCFTLAAPDATMDKAIGYLQNKIMQCDCRMDISITYLLLSRLVVHNSVGVTPKLNLLVGVTEDSSDIDFSYSCIDQWYLLLRGSQPNKHDNTARLGSL